MFFHQMFAEIPGKQGPSAIRNYNHMLYLLNHVLTIAPQFDPDGILVAIPMFAILRKPVFTVNGYAAFLNSTVNEHLKMILNEWGKFLKSPESCYVLTEQGWFSPKALEEMGGNFVKDFKCEPKKKHWGFKSWDDFFTREFRDNIRPIASPDDKNVIVSACEAAPLRVERNVQTCTKFWIKGQPYDIKFMLGDDPLAEKFIGGTVYQGFLSVFSYHRYHSPVDGEIVKAFVEDGSYFSFPQINEAEGFEDPITAAMKSQPYFSEVQTRGIVIIKADNPYIGIMCFIAIGMTEVSTTELIVYPGQRVKKGQEIGMFHFGGSTHCLIFRPGVELDFDFHGQTPGKKY